MIILERVSEEQIILCFLSGELNSERFSNKLKTAMEKLNIDDSLILNADLCNARENELRRQLLGEFRGYGKNEGLFENFPVVERYELTKFSIDELNKIKYINYSYWNELTDNTSCPLDAAKNIKKGKVVYSVSNQPFLEGVKLLEEGKRFEPVILLTSDYESFIILEGHSRLTIYALQEGLINCFEGYVLKCKEDELKKWNS